MRGIANVIEQRARLESRLLELGAKIPRRWEHDVTGELRNLQLLELVEETEAERRRMLNKKLSRPDKKVS